MDKIVLTEEKETLLIPLFGKARENGKETPVLNDKKAVEIVNQIDYNFKSLKIPEKTNVMMCIRFDAFSVLTAKHAANHPSLRKTGSKIRWGVDDPLELTKWGTEIHFIEEKYFTSSEAVKNLKTGTRTVFKIANLFSAARKAHRVLIYKIG